VPDLTEQVLKPREVLAVIPSAVDPPSGERTGTRGATVKPDVTRAAQPGAPGAGLLGFARVDGRRDDSPLLNHHPGVGAPPPEARGSGEAPRPQRAITTMTRASRPARERSGAGASASRRVAAARPGRQARLEDVQKFSQPPHGRPSCALPRGLGRVGV